MSNTAAPNGISTHPPRAGRDGTNGLTRLSTNYFNPPAPCGAGLHGLAALHGSTQYFNPPAPCGAGRQVAVAVKSGGAYFNPPAPCGAGRASNLHLCAETVISTHPPRAGRDNAPPNVPEQFLYFNPPAPCGAGPQPIAQRFRRNNFNPPAPCGAGLLDNALDSGRHIQFQPTRPVRGGTRIIAGRAVGPQ